MTRDLNRRSFLGGSASVLGAALLPGDTFAATPVAAEPGQATPGALDQFALAYMKQMRAPGMTVGLLSGDEIALHAYGYSDLSAKAPIEIAQPFWIGSICKSFVGIVVMQLRDEGKLDLHKPVLEIMPDLPFTDSFGKITTHHLLTHTSGLPNWLQLVPSCPSQRATQAYKPGERFVYCNLGYDTLGLLIGHLDGRSWAESVTARVLKPLGMTSSTGQIDDSVQARMPVGYHVQYRDRPSTVADPLVPVGYVTMSNAAGSIASPSGDMCKYMRMLLARGAGPAGRIVSEESFKLFSTPYIKAPDLSPTASYGYGIGVDIIEGRTMLRHTGGTTAFASSILVDLDSGVGAFASINAMQGYRPNPVTRFAVDLLHAKKSAQAAPAPPAIADPLAIAHPEALAGRYKASNGDLLTVAAKDGGLTITTALGTTTLRPLGEDTFSAADDSVLSPAGRALVPSAFPLVFERGKASSDAPNAPVTGIGYGPRWYASEHHAENPAAPAFAAAERYTGVYSNDSPWTNVVKIVERNGKLWLDGAEEMHPREGDRFSIEGGEGSLDLAFRSFLDRRAQVLDMGGEVLHRIALGPQDQG